MISNLSTLENATTAGTVVLYQNGTEVMNGAIIYDTLVVYGLDNLIMIQLVQLFILCILLSLFLIKSW